MFFRSLLYNAVHALYSRPIRLTSCFASSLGKIRSKTEFTVAFDKKNYGVGRAKAGSTLYVYSRINELLQLSTARIIVIIIYITEYHIGAVYTARTIWIQSR